MKNKKLFMLTVLLLVAALIFTGCGGSGSGGSQTNTSEGKTDTPDTQANNASQAPPKNEEKLKVGFVISGPADSVGYNGEVNNARLELEKLLPYVETVYVENVEGGGGESERAIRQLIEQGSKVIVASSFGFADAVQKLAKEYPNVYFLHSSGTKTADNLTTYSVREYEGAYLTGLIAGKMTKTNIIGYIASFPFPQILRSIDGFALGVKEVNPAAKVRLLFTGTFNDPPKEKEAANSLIDAKADVVAEFQNGPAPLQAAQERGVYAIGWHQDMQQYAPKAVLASFAWHWGPMFAKEVETYHNGQAKGRNIWANINEGGKVPINKDLVPTELLQLVEEYKEKLISGQKNVFQGPLKDNQGNIVVKEGEVLNDDDLITTNWLADNVIGKIK